MYASIKKNNKVFGSWGSNESIIALEKLVHCSSWKNDCSLTSPDSNLHYIIPIYTSKLAYLLL